MFINTTFNFRRSTHATAPRHHPYPSSGPPVQRYRRRGQASSHSSATYQHLGQTSTTGSRVSRYVSICTGNDGFPEIAVLVFAARVMLNCPSVCLSVCPSVRQSVRLPVCPSVRLSVCPSVRLSVCPSVRRSVRRSVRPSARRVGGGREGGREGREIGRE